jgi:hypothetical protein
MQIWSSIRPSRRKYLVLLCFGRGSVLPGHVLEKTCVLLVYSQVFRCCLGLELPHFHVHLFTQVGAALFLHGKYPYVSSS